MPATTSPIESFICSRIGEYVSFTYRKNDFETPENRTGRVESVTTAKHGGKIVLLKTSSGPRSFSMGRIVGLPGWPPC